MIIGTLSYDDVYHAVDVIFLLISAEYMLTVIITII